MVGSVVAHVGLVVIASLLPDGSGSGGAPARDKLFTPGAVIPIEAVPVVATKLEPTPAPNPEPQANETPDARPDPTQPAPQAGPAPQTGPAPPPEPTEAHPEPAGLALHGMRDNARPSTVGADKVVVDPAKLMGSRETYQDSVDKPGVGSGAVQGPSPAPPGSKDYAFTNEKGKLVYRDPTGRFIATLKADGRVDFKNKSAKATWTNIGMAGPGDLLSAAAGDDPYARIKQKLLKETFEMRLQMAVGFQKTQLDKRLRRLDSDLKTIWTDDKRELAARKKLLFERWDDCDEPEQLGASALPGFGAIDDSSLDEARQTAALSARRRILKFIREHAPKGSAEAFTAEELDQLNRRRVSKEKFAPYE